MLSILSLFASCSSIKVMDAIKEKNIAAIPNQDNYIVYEIDFKTDKSFTLNSLSIYSDNSTRSINSYSFINLQNQSGYMIKDNPKLFEKGNYRITFRMSYSHDFLNKESILIKYTVDHKIKTQKKRIRLSDRVKLNK